jgi:hypothetical protein
LILDTDDGRITFQIDNRDAQTEDQQEDSKKIRDKGGLLEHLPVDEVIQGLRTRRRFDGTKDSSRNE